jgi:hypothetical protein
LIGAALPDDFGGGGLTSAGYRSIGEYIFNDWRENKDGEIYTDRINARRPDLQGRISDLRSRIETFNEQFTKEYGSGPKFSRSGAVKEDGRSGNERLAEVRGGEQQTDRAGSQRADVQLTHYGRTKGLNE